MKKSLIDKILPTHYIIYMNRYTVRLYLGPLPNTPKTPGRTLKNCIPITYDVIAEDGDEAKRMCRVHHQRSKNGPMFGLKIHREVIVKRLKIKPGVITHD